MKAVQIAAPQKMAVVEIEKPELKAGEILVKIEYVGFCGSDLNTYLGRNPMSRFFASTVNTLPFANCNSTFLNFGFPISYSPETGFTG